MNKTDKAFRLIVLRRLLELDLFEDKGVYRYHAIASNRADEDAAATMEWYCQRGDASENRIKDLKIGFGMEYMPCGAFQANAALRSVRGGNTRKCRPYAGGCFRRRARSSAIAGRHS
jgi:hypothetical protein